MDNGTILLLFLLLIGCFTLYVWKQNKAISDGKAMFWTTVSEPLSYVSDDPFDTTVTERAQNARANLRAHKNGYLRVDQPDPKDDDVWEYVYSATPQTPTRDFALWQDMVLLEIVKRRELWRQKKAGYNPDAAKERFAGQTVYTQNGVN